MMTCAQHLIQLLGAYGVDTAFGIPGVHTIELYRELPGSGLRHYTPRHEQGAGFMADGYARASGKPAVCFIITGPGMTNIATAMGQALADSIPMLVISGVNATSSLGRGQGRLHEMPHQRETLAGVSVFSHTLLDPAALPEVMARAFAVFHGARPGPVHIEIPLDVMAASMPVHLCHSTPPVVPAFFPPAPAPQALALASRWLDEAQRPLVLMGGGSASAPQAARALVERLDAPTLTTINARGVLGHHHPLDLGCTATFAPIRELARDADVILALGTELGETDYDQVFDGGFGFTGKLIRVDIDSQQLARNHFASLAMVADVSLTLDALAECTTPAHRQGADICHRLRQRLDLEQQPDLAPYVSLFETLDASVPEAIIVGDSTGPVYAGNFLARRSEPRRWFNAATGFGTLGYGLPAALGASIARPDLPVVAIVGDGGLQFVLGELATARDLNHPIAIVVWNNDGYDEIRRYMTHDKVEHLGVDLKAPDFRSLSEAFHCRYAAVSAPDALGDALEMLQHAHSPLLIEVDALRWMNGAA